MPKVSMAEADRLYLSLFRVPGQLLLSGGPDQRYQNFRKEIPEGNVQKAQSQNHKAQTAPAGSLQTGIPEAAAGRRRWSRLLAAVAFGYR